MILIISQKGCSYSDMQAWLKLLAQLKKEDKGQAA